MLKVFQKKMNCVEKNAIHVLLFIDKEKYF